MQVVECTQSISNMADRRRRKLPSEGESEDETEDSLSPTRPPRASECESENDHKESEVSEYESTTEDHKEHEGEEEEDDDDEYETEEEEDVEEDDDDDDDEEGTYDGEEDEDVILEDELEDLIAEERESGDGQEQPEGGERVDDDEDKKNPAYVPRKGAFYEHDMRISMDNEAEEEEKKPKKKLWKDDGRWLHDKFRPEMQGPKSREEIVMMYGYDIRRGEKAPEGPMEINRPRVRRSQDKPQLSDFVQDKNDRYVEQQNAYNDSYSSMKQGGNREGYQRGYRGGRRGRGGGRQYNNSQEFEDRREYSRNTPDRDIHRREDRGYRGSQEKEYPRQDRGDYRQDTGDYRQDTRDYRQDRRGNDSQDSRVNKGSYRSERQGFQDDKRGYQSERHSYQNERRGGNNRENEENYQRSQKRNGFGDRRVNRVENDDSMQRTENRHEGFSDRNNQGRRNYENDRRQYNEGRRSYENDRQHRGEGRRSFERDVEPSGQRFEDNQSYRRQEYSEERSYRGGKGNYANEGRGSFRGRGRGGQGRGGDWGGDRGRRREERNYPPRLQKARQFWNQNIESTNSENSEQVPDSYTQETQQPQSFPSPPSIQEKKAAPVVEIVKQEDMNIVVQNQGEKKSYSKDRRARYVGKTRVQDQPANQVEQSLANMADREARGQDEQVVIEGDVQQYEGKSATKQDPSQQGKPKRYSSQRQRTVPDMPYTEQVEGSSYYSPASPSFPAPPPPQPPMLQSAITFAQPGGIPSPRVFVPQQPPQSTGVSMATQVPVIPPQYNNAGVIFSPPTAPPPTFQVRPVVRLQVAPTMQSQAPPLAPPLAPPPQAAATSQPQELVRGGTTYYSPELQYAGGQQQKRAPGGTTYYPPEMQYKGSKRSPVRRPKAAIPIVNPQDVKGRKQGKDKVHDSEILNEPGEYSGEGPSSLEMEEVAGQMEDRGHMEVGGLEEGESHNQMSEEGGLHTDEGVLSQASDKILSDNEIKKEPMDSLVDHQFPLEIKQEPVETVQEQPDRVAISDADRYTICVNDDTGLGIPTQSRDNIPQSDVVKSENSELGKSVPQDSLDVETNEEKLEIKQEMSDHEEQITNEIGESCMPSVKMESTDLENKASSNSAVQEGETIKTEANLDDQEHSGKEDESMELEDFSDAKETFEDEEKK